MAILMPQENVVNEIVQGGIVPAALLAFYSVLILLNSGWNEYL